MRQTINGYIQQTSGVAAVEFALLAPLLMVLLIGTIDFGDYLNEKMKLESVANTTVEYMIKNGSEEDIELVILPAYYEDEAADDPALSAFSVNVNLACECANAAPVICTDTCPDADDYKRRFYEVRIDKSHSPLFSYPGIGDTMTITGHARMQMD